MNAMLRWCGAVFCLAMVGCSGSDDGSGEEAGAEDGVLRDSLGRELSPISAAIVRANPNAEADAVLLARLEVQPNELVEFHELEPGMVVISGSGRPNAAPIGEAMTDSRPTLRAVWAELSGNAPMPLALAEAVERVETMPPQATTVEAEEDVALPEADAAPADAQYASHAPLPVEGAAHLSSAWCDDEYYSAVDAGFSLIANDPNESILGACLSPNVYPKVQCFDHVTGDWTASARGSWQKANVCPYRGNLTWTLRVKGVQRLQKTVLENTVHWNKVIDRGSTSTMTVILSNAANDGYQFRFFGG